MTPFMVMNLGFAWGAGAAAPAATTGYPAWQSVVTGACAFLLVVLR